MFASHSTAHTRTRPRIAANIVARLRLALVVRAQRRALARADARLLNDIGLTRDQADAEAKRPLWDVPSNWLR